MESYHNSVNGNINAKSILQNAETKLAEQETNNSAQNLFMILTASEWIARAKTRPVPKMLFSEFWHEEELCILFADTNLGKSILATQIANSISRGEQIFGFKLESGPQKVLYCDFEMSSKQFEARYSQNFANHYCFEENFIRLEINPDADIPEKISFEDYLNFSLDDALNVTQAKALIIDNITYLKSETEKAKDALPLMKHLKQLKDKYTLSILCLAHTPKRDLTKPITRNDLQGSKMLINFCDSAFAIGESSLDKNLRYLKQVKARSTEIIYDADNVCVCSIQKPHNFLRFEFANFATEREHIRQFTEHEKGELEKAVNEFLEREPHARAYSIAKHLCKDETKFESMRVRIDRILKRRNKGNKA